MLTLLIVSLLVLFGLNMPVAFALAGASLVFMLFSGGTLSLEVLPQKMATGADSFPLLAVPFFVLAGSLMNTGGITNRLVQLASALVGHIRGGLAHVVVVTNMLMAGVSGSALADAVGTGSVLIPAMERKGYSTPFAAAITGAAGTIGPIIPPSIPFVVVGSITGVSIGRLFLGGAIPGILMGLYLMVFAYFIARRRNYPREERASLGKMVKAFMDAFLAIIMPLIILGGILGGAFTPTEAAIVASVYAWVVGMFVYRELRLKHLPKILTETVVSTASLLLIISAASPFATILTWQGAAKQLTDLMMSVTSNSLLLLLVINLVLLTLGCFMEGLSLIIILVPMLMPLVTRLGIDPVHFCVVFVLNTTIGTLTPPFGVIMFAMVSLARTTISKFSRECWPFIAALILVLLLITVIPGLVLWLPNVLMGAPK
jgi:tripartite ATP-independent transporter DctM subunit